MQEPVQIYFDEAALGALLAEQSLHSIARLAIQQRVLRILAAAPTPGAGDESGEAARELRQALGRMGLEVQSAPDASLCDYAVHGETAGQAGSGNATPLDFATFGQYLRKMIS